LPEDRSPPDPASLQFLWGKPGDDKNPSAWIKPDADGSTDKPSKDWYWVADAIAAPGDGGKQRLIVFLWRITRTDAKVMGFRSAGTHLAIVDDATADWSPWQPRQVRIKHAIPASSEDSRRGSDTIWGSEVILDESAGNEPRVLIFGYRQQGKL